MLLVWLFGLGIYNTILAFQNIQILSIIVIISIGCWLYTRNNRDYNSNKEFIYFGSLYTIYYCSILIFIKVIVKYLLT